MVFVLEGALSFRPTALRVHCVHGGEIRGDDSLCRVTHRCLPLSENGVSVPYSDTAGEDTFNKPSVDLSECVDSLFGLLQQPDEI